MLSNPQTFIRLPNEKILFTSPARTALSLTTPNTYPGKEPLSIKCPDGKATITNQRVRTLPPEIYMNLDSLPQLIYLPTIPTPHLQSFSSPLLSLQDTHVSAPFFGPNTWEGILIPTVGGGIPPHHALVNLKLTFKEGGAFDFSSTFERIKEVLGLARENGRAGEAEDLEELPAYEEGAGAAGVQGGSGVVGGAAAGGVQIQRPTPIGTDGVRRARPAPPANNGVVGLDVGQGRRGGEGAVPDEPPPGYEEVQASSVAERLESNVRTEN